MKEYDEVINVDNILSAPVDKRPLIDTLKDIQVETIKAKDSLENQVVVPKGFKVEEGMLWNYINQGDTAKVCRNMYPKEDSNYGVTSDLINSYMWDTAIVYIQAMDIFRRSTCWLSPRNIYRIKNSRVSIYIV